MHGHEQGDDDQGDGLYGREVLGRGGQFEKLPEPPAPDALSTRTVQTNKIETISPPVVSTVPGALRSTCRRITCRSRPGSTS
ncbi:hypothetical protein [Streptomyces sp. MMG1121]|uniref:hypothetical protein n=1 Tax=Streptomyces sp. MMG1121 TaxID=1415544 RepID=UPI0006AFCC84|nr:hypothetical protein [Streptomyces sp. MMG1121]